jgi:hypothetical protein
MRLKSVHAFGGVFDLVVTREAGRVRLEVQREGRPAMVRTAAEGAAMAITLD